MGNPQVIELALANNRLRQSCSVERLQTLYRVSRAPELFPTVGAPGVLRTVALFD